MAQQNRQGKSTIVPPEALLSRLDRLELEKGKQLNERFKDVALETQLLALSGVSIEQEIEKFQDILSQIRKTAGR